MRYRKPFDPEMDAQAPYGYDNYVDEARYQEKYETSNEVDKQKMLNEQIEYWKKFEKYLHKYDIHFFDESLKNAKKVIEDNPSYIPEICGEIKNTNGFRVKIRLSTYIRLFASIQMDLPFCAKTDFSHIEFVLENYVTEWGFPLEKSLSNEAFGIGENLHIHAMQTGQFDFCTSFKDHETGRFDEIESDFQWFMRIIAIAREIVSYEGDFVSTHATECREYLENLCLEGHKIIAVKNNNYLDDTFSEGVGIEMGGFFTLELDDGRMIGFSFDKASSVAIMQFYDWNLIENEERASDQFSKQTTAEIFEGLIGKKIADVRVEATDNVDDVLDGYWPEDLSEKQGDFIRCIQIKFTDGAKLLIDAGDDWTDVELQS